jgi:hypothetical protein
MMFAVSFRVQYVWRVIAHSGLAVLTRCSVVSEASLVLWTFNSGWNGLDDDVAAGFGLGASEIWAEHCVCVAWPTGDESM